MELTHSLFLALLTAHLWADFALQTDRDIAAKGQGWIFGKHIAIVTLLSWALAGDWTNWIIPAVIGVSHGLLDWGKLAGLRSGWNETRLFVWDQVAHVAVILCLTVFHANRGDYSNVFLERFGEIYAPLLLILSGFVVAVQVGGLVIGKASAGFLVQVKNASEGETPAESAEASREGLRQGGKVIGQLERALIFFFVLAGTLESVAFLVAAKSIFRFGELTKNSRKEAEYILIGTLMSFGWGLVVAWFTRYLIDLS